MIDRLSILALKIYHTREEAHRTSATEEHRQRNTGRLALLEEQRDDLADCLDALWAEVLQGTRRFKLYRQMKMYNDPELNPAVYGQRPAELQVNVNGPAQVDLTARSAYKTDTRINTKRATVRMGKLRNATGDRT